MKLYWENGIIVAMDLKHFRLFKYRKDSQNICCDNLSLIYLFNQADIEYPNFFL